MYSNLVMSGMIDKNAFIHKRCIVLEILRHNKNTSTA